MKIIILQEKRLATRFNLCVVNEDVNGMVLEVKKGPVQPVTNAYFMNKNKHN